MGLFYKGNGKESQNKKRKKKKKKTEEPKNSIKEKLNVEQSHTLGN